MKIRASSPSVRTIQCKEYMMQTKTIRRVTGMFSFSEVKAGRETGHCIIGVTSRVLSSDRENSHMVSQTSYLVKVRYEPSRGEEYLGYE